jgi:hypothetical protein
MRTQKGDISILVRRGTFLFCFDTTVLLEHSISLGPHCARRGAICQPPVAAQSLVKPSALHSSEPTPLCTKNNPAGSYFFFTEASRA